MSPLEQKKQEKRQALLDAAYDLFLQHGTAKTSVSDITGRANVAKGTFYLYFKDKDAVLQALLGRISYRVLNDAYQRLSTLGSLTFADGVIALADYIIEYFRREKLVLQLMQRSFKWPTLEEMDAGSGSTPLFDLILNSLAAWPETAGRPRREILQRMSVIIGMCASVCYSSIIEGRPDTIDNMKPVLYDIIRKAL
jgi:AcrR family transcriptional regulator